MILCAELGGSSAHSTYKLFLALYLAHLLTDFVLQADALVAGKKQGKWRSYPWHGVIYYGTILAVVIVSGI